MSIIVSQAAITNYHGLRGLNNKHLLFIVIEAGKSKAPADSVSGIWQEPVSVELW